MFKTILLLSVVAIATAYPRVPELVNDAELIFHINQNQSEWIAAASSRFEKFTIEEARKMMGVLSLVPSGDIPIKTHNIEASELPESFDARTQWPSYLHPIRDQQQCGSCWAFSASEVLSDRFAIATEGKINVVLSPEDMVSCDTGDMGCSGGMLDTEWKYLVETGIVSDSCFPYSAGKGVAPACQTKCADSESFTKYKAADSFHLTKVEDIQAEIMKNGPVQAAFMVHKSFMTYKSGVYNRHWWDVLDSQLGGHAVKIVGWGVEGSLPYWIVANSWGTSWGENGYFRIARGKDVCKFESMVYGGHPAL